MLLYFPRYLRHTHLETGKLLLFFLFLAAVFPSALSVGYYVGKKGVSADSSFNVDGVNVLTSLQELQAPAFSPQVFYIDSNVEEPFTGYQQYDVTGEWEHFPSLNLTFHLHENSAVMLKANLILTGADGCRVGLRLVVDGVPDSRGLLFGTAGSSDEDEIVTLHKVVELSKGTHNITYDYGGPNAAGSCDFYVGVSPSFFTSSLLAVAIPLVEGVVYGNVEPTAADPLFPSPGEEEAIPGLSVATEIPEDSIVYAESGLTFSTAANCWCVFGLAHNTEVPEAYTHSQPLGGEEFTTIHATIIGDAPHGTNTLAAFWMNGMTTTGDLVSKPVSQPLNYFQRISYMYIPKRYGAQAGMEYNKDPHTLTSTTTDVTIASVTLRPLGPATMYTAVVVANAGVVPANDPYSYAIFRLATDGSMNLGLHCQAERLNEDEHVHLQDVVSVTPNRSHTFSFVGRAVKGQDVLASSAITLQQVAVLLLPQFPV